MIEVRSKILAALKADAALTAIVPAARIYPSKTPASVTWPFMRTDGQTTTPERFDGVDVLGASVTGLVHCFVKVATGTPDPEATCANINAHTTRILETMDSIALTSGLKLSVFVRQSQVLPDPEEADAYHGFVSYEATAA